MIKILDSNFKRQAILKKAINPIRFEEVNGENTLDFNAVLDEKVSTHLDENAVIEIDNDYFDIAYLKKDQNQDGTLTVEVETEHISYRLNNPEYDMDYFTEMGTPTYILGKILEGTGFIVGTVEYDDTIIYSAQEKKSRRQLLMEFVAYLDGEIDFNKFTISIIQHRGSTEPKKLAKGKNIKVISKIYNKRELDDNGNPLVSYTCTPIQLPNKAPLELGDEVLLLQNDLGIKEQLRIVSIRYNPYDNIEVEIEIANFISGLEDDIYRIETTTLAKGKNYYGIRIGSDDGFISERSDKKSMTTINADVWKIEKGSGDGTYDTTVFEVDSNGELVLNTQQVNDLDGRVTTNESNISINSNNISTNVSSITNVDGRVTTNESNITQNANEIELKVSSDDVISSINLSPESIVISSSKLDLVGLVTVTDLSGSGTTTINGDNITTGSISADIISGGTISGVSIDIDTDLYVGDYIYLGDMAGTTNKKIYFNYDADITYYSSNGDLSINSWGDIELWGDDIDLISDGDIDINSSGNLYLDASGTIELYTDLDFRNFQLQNAYGISGWIAESMSDQRLRFQVVTETDGDYLEVWDNRDYKGTVKLG